MSNKIPTADEILTGDLLTMVKSVPKRYVPIEEMKNQPEWGVVQSCMIKFAKLHVKAALEKAAKNCKMKTVYDSEGSHFSWSTSTKQVIDTESITTAYLEKLIK